MTKAPEEIIDEGWANGEIVCGWDVRTILDQAGWAIVPKEPTEAMCKSVNACVLRTRNFAPDKFRMIYERMLAAAQTKEADQPVKD